MVQKEPPGSIRAKRESEASYGCIHQMTTKRPDDIRAEVSGSPQGLKEMMHSDQQQLTRDCRREKNSQLACTKGRVATQKPVDPKMKIRQVIQYIIPATGTIHFSVALLWWCDLLFYVAGLETLMAIPTNRLLLCIVIPLQSCLALLAGFATALFFTIRNRRIAHPLTVASVGNACLFFVLSSTSSFAQVHVLCSPGLNHFYATWWLYSRFPPLSMPARTLVAAAIFVATITLSHCCRHQDAVSSRR